MIEGKEILIKEGKLLPLIEEFYTLQGEGYHTGKPAYFLRLGGCDIGCEWCDTKFSWDKDIHTLVKVEAILKNILKYPAKTVVVTGGEPALYNLNYLCTELKKHNIKTYIETSGNNRLTGEWDWICLSPKKTMPPVPSIYKIANELKVIIKNNKDFSWAEKNAELVNKQCKLYLQPEWSRYNNIIFDITEYIKENPKWCISLQSHKFMHIP